MSCFFILLQCEDYYSHQLKDAIFLTSNELGKFWLNFLVFLYKREIYNLDYQIIYTTIL